MTTEQRIERLERLLFVKRGKKRVKREYTQKDKEKVLNKLYKKPLK